MKKHEIKKEVESTKFNERSCKNCKYFDVIDGEPYCLLMNKPANPYGYCNKCFYDNSLTHDIDDNILSPEKYYSHIFPI